MRGLVCSGFTMFFTLITFATPCLAEEDLDPPEVALGHRLFKETRFAQYFYAHGTGGVNKPLNVGDPVVSITRTLGKNIPGPYAGKSISCAACHLVSEHQETPGMGTRAYTDFSRRSLIPVREDGRIETPRNTPTMVNASIERNAPFFLHFDGQFITSEDLVKGTLLGRNFGWLPHEKKAAVAHIARVVREDDGTDDLAHEFYGSYQTMFLSADPSIPEKFRLPISYRMDIAHSSDEEILEGIANLISAYSRSLVYSKDEQGLYNGSPYDLFLAKNQLPRRPSPGESDLQYARRLGTLLEELKTPVYVSEGDGKFKYHQSQPFVFRENELKGMKIFFTEVSEKHRRKQGVGNCIACHVPPEFTDFKFHNIGVTQDEYESIHGDGTFLKLRIPSLEERNQKPELYLPPSESHPNALGLFMSVPTQSDFGKVDLGLWNVFANPDQPSAQSSLRKVLMAHLKEQNASSSGTESELLESSIALVKTPSVRDLGQSEPYFHTGHKEKLENVIELYIFNSELMRNQALRNGDVEMSKMFLNDEDIAPLTAFLKSLNEDYD